MVELISVSKDENPKLSYPAVIRSEGIAPSQYGTKSILGDRFVDIEEKYDLTKGIEGFSEEGESGDADADAEAEEESNADDKEDV